MRIHVIQHVPFEGPGYIGDWADQHDHELSFSHLYEWDALPGVGTFDFLVIMGGPMSVNDESAYPWLAEEKRFIRESIEAGKSVLGICLGAQLIASALGAKIYPNVEKEIGWFPVVANSDVKNNSLFKDLPPEFPAFHWHGETFDLPEGATHIAASDACVNQAFAYGDRVAGLQFHLEVTENSIADLIENCRDDMTPGPYVQAASDIHKHIDFTDKTRIILDNLLANLTA